MNDERPHDPHEDADEPGLEALLRGAGPRRQPPLEAATQVRAAVEAEWRAMVATRRAQRRRQLTPWAVAASVALVAVGAWLLLPQRATPSPMVASAARVEGDVQWRDGTGDAWSPLAPSAGLAQGAELRTAAKGRVALRRKDGVEIRLDSDSALQLAALDAARLDAGRAYVDAGVGPTSQASAFTLHTRLGVVRHLGTQYLVEVTPRALSVAVREGSVAVERGNDPVIARAGESVVVADAGPVSRGHVEPRDARWLWTEAVAPGFAIAGRSLDDFLDWASRETGRRLVYASPEAAREASGIALRGSVSGLAPEQAVAAVMATTPSLQHRFEGAELQVERATR